MLKNLNINYLINNVIYIINSHYKYHEIPSPLKNYLYLIATGMILNYGENYIEDIYETIFGINFLLPSITNKNLHYETPTNNNYLEKNIVLQKNKRTCNYNLLFMEIDNSPIKTLEYLTYKINYILFNKHKKISLKNNIKLKLSALNSHLIIKDNDKDNILSNVFNTIQTNEIIKIILSIAPSTVTNVSLHHILTNLSQIDLNTYQVEGLDIIANLFIPLYKENKLKHLIDSYNNINLIKKELNTVLGYNAYKDTYDQLIHINNLLSTNTTNNYYELSNYYVNIRNNIINRYLYLTEA